MLKFPPNKMILKLFANILIANMIYCNTDIYSNETSTIYSKNINED
jgi:hypothetical protein